MSDDIAEEVLLIMPKPQVAVDLNVHGEVVISVTSIGEDYNSVESVSVKIPLDDAKAVALAIVELAEKHGV